MDTILSELFGGDESDAGTGTRSDTADKPADPEREARREARQRRKADAEARRSRKEFIERYTTGDPSEGFTTEEAIAHLREMRDEMTPGSFAALCSVRSSISRPASAMISSGSCASTRPARPSRRPAAARQRQVPRQAG